MRVFAFGTLRQLLSIYANVFKHFWFIFRYFGPFFLASVEKLVSEYFRVSFKAFLLTFANVAYSLQLLLYDVFTCQLVVYSFILFQFIFILVMKYI